MAVPAVFALLLYWYIGSIEARGGGRVHWIVALVYNWAGKTGTVLLFGIPGAIFAIIGIWKLVSRVFLDNVASRGLLQALGFREVGIYEKHGKLDGTWRDVVIVERLLSEILLSFKFKHRTSANVAYHRLC